MYRLKAIGKIQTKNAAEVSSSRLGIGFEKLDKDAFDPEKAYDKMCDIGVKWIRIQSGWQKTEKVKGVYDFAWLDAIVDNIIERNMTPWMCVLRKCDLRRHGRGSVRSGRLSSYTYRRADRGLGQLLRGTGKALCRKGYAF